MAVSKYYQVILDTLQGHTAPLRDIPAERLDWEGVSAFLALFRSTSGRDRAEFIRAMGQVLHDREAPPPVLAQLVDLASALDLAQVEPEVRRLQQEGMATKEPLRRSVTNFLAFRELNALGQAPSPSVPLLSHVAKSQPTAGNGKAPRRPTKNDRPPSRSRPAGG